jgi:hypothetical protein
MQAESFTGGCLCGAVRYQAAGAATNLCFCHCTSCRRAIGAPMVPWGTFAVERLVITRGRLMQYHSSPNVTRGFCAECGSSLTYQHDDRNSEIDVTLSTLDDPVALVPDAHIWVEDKPSWVVIADGRPQFARSRAGES